MMKLRWHLLFILIASAAAFGVAAWLKLPVWSADGYELIRYVGKNVERFELISLSSANGQKDCFLEIHDWRTGQLLRKLSLEVEGWEGYVHYLDVAKENESSNAPMLFTRHRLGKSTACFLLDPDTGKQLQHAPLAEWCLNEKLARHKDKLALALKSEVRLFFDKFDPGRSIPLTGIKKISLSPDGVSLLCVGNDGLLSLVNVQSSEVIKLTGCEMKAFDASFLKNGELLVTSFNDGAAFASQVGLSISRWQREGSELYQTCPGVLLGSKETTSLGIPMPVHFQEPVDGTLQIELYQGTSWPDFLPDAMAWLEHHGYSLEKVYSKKNFTLCYELNSSNQIMSINKKWFDHHIKLDEDRSVSYQPGWYSGKTMAVFHSRRIWLWVLAVWIMVYAGLWRTVRWKKNRAA
ncbi:MAG: hypothetical protein QM703_19025 [Gemmatales bacterium]